MIEDATTHEQIEYIVYRNFYHVETPTVTKYAVLLVRI